MNNRQGPLCDRGNQTSQHTRFQRGGDRPFRHHSPEMVLPTFKHLMSKDRQKYVQERGGGSRSWGGSGWWWWWKWGFRFGRVVLKKDKVGVPLHSRRWNGDPRRGRRWCRRCREGGPLTLRAAAGWTALVTLPAWCPESHVSAVFPASPYPTGCSGGGGGQ